jgi:predicted phosphodiesterase
LDEAILENDALPQHQRRTNQAIADEYGTSEAAVRRHRKALKRRSEMSKGGVDEYFGVPVEAISARGKTVRLADGSYEKITYKPGVIERGEVQAKRFEDLAPIFAEPVSPAPDVKSQSTVVVVVSDLQIGKTDRGGGTEETIRRVRAATARIADHVAGRYRKVILVDCGDSTEGFSNTASQAQTNDLPLTYQIRTAQALLADTLRVLAPAAPEVTYVAVPSNHCQVRVGIGRSNRASFPGDDYGLLIADNIQQIVAGRPGYEHVQFETPERRLESLTVRAADGTVMGVTHGHAAGSKNHVADWFRGQAFGCVAGMQNARVLLHGHWHSFSVQTVGDSRQIICAPTIDPGSAWFQNASGDSSRPALLTFELSGGTSSGWRLWP